MNDNENNQMSVFDGLNVISETSMEAARNIQETINNSLSALGNVMSEVAKSTDIIREVSICISDFTDSLRSTLAETAYSVAQSIIKDFHQNLIDTLIDECEATGSMGWCFHGMKGVGDELSIVFFRQAKYEIDNGDATLAEIDEYITKRLTKDTIDEVVSKTAKLLSPEDAIKFQKAMIDYRARRYYDSANLLAGLIDSQSIKEIMLHGNPEDNISQGWQAFAIAYKNKFSNKLDTSSMKPKSRKRDEEFTDFVNTNKENEQIDTHFITQKLLLCYSLLSFFHNNDWRDYPNKPAVINRNWLAHGMYDYDDIKKSDCLKLLFMLNQVANLFKREE